MSIYDLSLARALTARVKAAIAGNLNYRDAEIFDHVTDVTGDLIEFWFGERRNKHPWIQEDLFQFHLGQKQAILNVIYAHEVIGAKNLLELYRAVLPEALENNDHYAELTKPIHDWQKYCLKMATGTGKTWVMQALMIWQILNYNRNKADPRFTNNFLIVAPGLPVYDRLRDALQGKIDEEDNKRYFRGNPPGFRAADVYGFRALFAVPSYETEITKFFERAFVGKQDIGNHSGHGGIIALTNWHQFSEDDAEMVADDWEDTTPISDPKQIIADLIPLPPRASNSLDVLDRRAGGNRMMELLRKLPRLMVFNDEGHHLHDTKRDGMAGDSRWQQAINKIVKTKENGGFCQVDFSATPYEETIRKVKTAKNRTVETPEQFVVDRYERDLYFFPHVMVNFDLTTAISEGLVKSLVLDCRNEDEIKDADQYVLEFRADRDERGTPTLSMGQKIMLRAGLAKIAILQKEFLAHTTDGKHYPKMLVVCEDTSVTSEVEKFLLEEGLGEDEIVLIDSKKKDQLSEDDWARLKSKLSNIDSHPKPKVIINVLMLREGFDVNNICVIVPLRSTSSGKLLEQTVGRGLRLMWRGRSYDDVRLKNRQLIAAGKPPSSLFDILYIIEHPRFREFYQNLIQDGLVGTEAKDDPPPSAQDGSMMVGLRPDYQEYDFIYPLILDVYEEHQDMPPLRLQTLSQYPVSLAQILEKSSDGIGFTSEDSLAKTRFGTYFVTEGEFSAKNYNSLLAVFAKKLADDLLDGNEVDLFDYKSLPKWQNQIPNLMAGLDAYFRQYLFDQEFDPRQGSHWRILNQQKIGEHIMNEWSELLSTMVSAIPHEKYDLRLEKLSRVDKIKMPREYSMPVNKSIYTHQNWPKQSGGLEQAFIIAADRDGSVDAFCKIDYAHQFLRIPYRNANRHTNYTPDFLVRCGDKIFVVETKSDDRMGNEDVKLKQKAAEFIYARINSLPPKDRDDKTWHYRLLSQSEFEDSQKRGQLLKDILDL
ncbi:MAG: DEAD/DEAH box helicase family protein [Candidatus Symbiobacter sp.]|nr:DEAD/DEAH box helicase family protein [Candidatus Symbiobacter sp.]